MTKFYARFSYSWTRFIFAGLLVGCLVFLFPGLYCEGYHLIGRMLNGDFYSLAAGGVLTTADSLPTVIIAGGIGILVVKAFATSSTICGGGVAGEFAPSIMIGAVLGMIYVYGMNHIFGLNLGYPAYIVLGMAGVLSGAVRAPLTGLISYKRSSHNALRPVFADCHRGYVIVSCNEYVEFAQPHTEKPAAAAQSCQSARPEELTSCFTSEVKVLSAIRSSRVICIR